MPAPGGAGPIAGLGASHRSWASAGLRGRWQLHSPRARPRRRHRAPGLGRPLARPAAPPAGTLVGTGPGSPAGAPASRPGPPAAAPTAPMSTAAPRRLRHFHLRRPVPRSPRRRSPRRLPAPGAGRPRQVAARQVSVVGRSRGVRATTAPAAPGSPPATPGRLAGPPTIPTAPPDDCAASRPTAGPETFGHLRRTRRLRHRPQEASRPKSRAGWRRGPGREFPEPGWIRAGQTAGASPPGHPPGRVGPRPARPGGPKQGRTSRFSLLMTHARKRAALASPRRHGPRPAAPSVRRRAKSIGASSARAVPRGSGPWPP